MKVLVFAASARRESVNKRLAALAASVLEGQGAQVDHAQFEEFDSPLYHGDTETEQGIPPRMRRLIERIENADAVFIASPEYNGFIPGTLKNALDWVSRKRPMPWTDKPIAIVGATPGGGACTRMLATARLPFEYVGAYVFPRTLGVPHASEAFTTEGTLADPALAQRLEKLAADFLVYAEKLAAN